MKKFLLIIVILVVVAGFIASGWFLLQVFNPLKIKEPANFIIKTGEGVNQISANLKEAGYIRNSLALEVYVYLKGIEGDFQAGEYSLPSVLNTKRLVEILTFGQIGQEWELKVIEGWTLQEVGERLEELGRLETAEFLKTTKGEAINKYGYEFLEDKPVTASLEGYLFPDTYRFFDYASEEDIVRKMLNNFDKKLSNELRAEIKNQKKSIFEIVTLASIVEREVNIKQSDPSADAAIVAGIFWKRIESGMPLQADSTVNYITGKNTPAVSAEDLKINSLYNTYLYPDLPPGPISNPGLAAIKAAIYPKESEYWFFLTDKEGNVHYAKDFEEHKANKAKYLAN